MVTENTVIANTGFSQFIGVSPALVCANGSAVIHIIIKKLSINKVYFAISTIYGTYLGLPISLGISVIFILTKLSHKNINCELKYLGLDVLFGSIGGILAVFGPVLLNISLQYEEATKVSIVRTIDVLFSFVFQFIILNIAPDYISIIGATCILLSTFIILFYKMFFEIKKR